MSSAESEDQTCEQGRVGEERKEEGTNDSREMCDAVNSIQMFPLSGLFLFLPENDLPPPLPYEKSSLLKVQTLDHSRTVSQRAHVFRLIKLGPFSFRARGREEVVGADFSQQSDPRPVPRARVRRPPRALTYERARRATWPTGGIGSSWRTETSSLASADDCVGGKEACTRALVCVCVLAGGSSPSVNLLLLYSPPRS